MSELTRCVDQHCLWRKECLRSCAPGEVKRGDAYFVSPRTSEGCSEFRSEDCMRKELADRKEDC